MWELILGRELGASVLVDLVDAEGSDLSWIVIEIPQNS